MTTNFTFRNINSTDGIKEHAREKLQKLDKYLIKPDNIHVICSLDSIDQCAEITLFDNGHQYVCNEKSSDMYVSIDRAIEKLARQLRRQKEKLKDKKHVKPLREISA